MRLAVQFSSKRIPIDYRMMLVSMIKECLKNADPRYYTRMYETGKSQMKPFATATYLRNFRIGDKIIEVDGFTLIVSSPDQEFMLHLYNGLLQMRTCVYRDFVLERANIRPLRERIIYSDTVLFRTLSPILVEDKQGCPVAPNSDSYPDNLNYFADLILENYRGYGLRRQLDVRVGRMRKRVIKETNRVFEQATNGQKWLYFTAYDGYLELTGEPSDLQLLYQLGLSKRRSQNFGLLEVERDGVTRACR